MDGLPGSVSPARTQLTDLNAMQVEPNARLHLHCGSSGCRGVIPTTLRLAVVRVLIDAILSIHRGTTTVVNSATSALYA